MDIPAVPPPLPSVGTTARRLPLARTGLILAILTICGTIGYVLKAGALSRQAEPLRLVQPSTMATVMARYFIGFQRMMKTGGQWNAGTAAQLSGELDMVSKTPADKFRVEIVRAVLRDQWPAKAVMDKLILKAPNLRQDVAALHDLEENGAGVSKDNWDLLLKRHGWIARLARAYALEWDGDDSAAVEREAMGTAGVIGGASMLGLGTLVLGIILAIKTFISWRRGQLRPRLLPPDKTWAPCLLEGFAIYMFGYTIVLSQARSFFPSISSVALYSIALVFVIIAMVWPRLRGMEAHAWRQTLGLHKGEGWLREMKFGILGWITGLPLLGACAFVASFIIKWTGQDASHPIVDELAQPGAERWGLVALAVVFAPLVEETMFRGLLFPGLTSFTRWVVGALIGAFIFAVIHPQGWGGVPPIMAIALTMSTLRAFRGSLVASMTAHALNNGLVSAMLLLVTA